MRNELSQKVRDGAIRRFAEEHLLEDCLTIDATFSSIFQPLLLLVFPIFRHRAILAQVVVVVKVLLILDYSDEHFDDVLLDRLTNARKSKHLLEDLVSNLFWRYLCIQHMLLEESILTVHMGAIEESIPINDLIPVILAKIVIVVVFLVLDVVLVATNVLLFDWAGCWQRLSWCSFSLEAKRPILSFDLSSNLL